MPGGMHCSFLYTRMSAVTFCDESHALFIFIYVCMSTAVACMPTLAGTDQVKCHSSRMKSMKAGAIFNFIIIEIKVLQF